MLVGVSELMSRHAEVGKLGLSSLRNHDVFGFEILVNHLLAVQVLKGQQHARSVILSQLRSKAFTCIVFVHLDQVKKLATRTVLHPET